MCQIVTLRPSCENRGNHEQLPTKTTNDTLVLKSICDVAQAANPGLYSNGSTRHLCYQLCNAPNRAPAYCYFYYDVCAYCLVEQAGGPAAYQSTPSRRDGAEFRHLHHKWLELLGCLRSNAGGRLVDVTFNDFIDEIWRVDRNLDRFEIVFKLKPEWAPAGDGQIFAWSKNPRGIPRT